MQASIVGSDRTKDVRFEVLAGKPFHYRVALRNTLKRPFHFSSCPVYIESITAASERHVLNCKPAGTFAAGETIVFEMVLRVPANARLGADGLAWELGQRTLDPPFADAGIVVRS